ncbi:RNA polymerase sigma factor [Pseudobacteroides cellulosolvens]|uniref:RNA polymerase, sigma-24 subunit, RpoE, ECF subfamily n=1 Tax=Pseudobacteroides cellulosolvens ATCC 35603 = DSM 2933 TaxID=398512 RepID=A0A0L6JWE2_9FIRM|nr:RNA polymerase sigma factor [Pseudobacteroides cellulosolvens]KNY29935.1 RNA polymerase, sigma-24 subunit, RpoE, ECF subfamily [Pseudobacteroides cellulosolvens ATCC 35603 = DSM 2933]
MEGFKKIYKDNYYKVNNYLRNICKDIELAEDLTQETFYKALLMFYNDKSSYLCTKWLIRVAHNNFIDYVRKNKINMVNFEPFHEDVKTEVNSDTDKIHLVEALGMLTLRFRTVLLLKDHYGFSYKEIAGIINSTESIVKVTLHRARKRFKEVYNDHE